MGDRSVCSDYGGGNGGWWLAHHSHARPSGGEVAAGPWLCGRNHCRANHSSGELLRHSTLNYTRNFHVDHGRRGGKTFLWSPLDSGGTNCLGLGFHSPRHRPDRLRARTRNWNSATLNQPGVKERGHTGHQASDLTNYPFSIDTEVAFITAKTLSPFFRFIRSTEPVVIIDVTIPASVRMTTSDTTLSETIFSIVPGNRFRILMLIGVRP